MQQVGMVWLLPGGYPLYRDGVISDESVFWEHIDMACGNLWMPGVETTRQSLSPLRLTPKSA
jgi:hypothetical protein